MILYREKTQIRLCINITDAGKHEKNVTFWNRDMPYCSDIKRTFKLKNVLLRDHSKRLNPNYNCCR